MTPVENSGEQLSTREKVGYALGDTASNLFWMSFVYFGNYFYTDVFGLAPAAMATLFFVTRIWDAINDPLMGMIADRTSSRWGKFRPYLLWMVLPFGVFGALAFVTPDFDAQGKLIWAYVTYTLIGMVYTAINLPYSALMGVISPNSQERTKVSTYRFVGAYSGGLIVSLTLRYFVGLFGGGDEQLGFALTMGVFALVAMGMFLVTFLSTRERVKPPANQSSDFTRDLGDVLTNGPWLVLFLLGILTLSYVSIRNGSAFYYFKYYVGTQTVFGVQLTPDAMVTAFFTLGSIATLLGTTLTARFARVLGKRRLYMLLMGSASLTTISFYFLRPEDVWLAFVLQVLNNLLSGPTAALVFAMYADASDYAEWKTGRRSTGLVFAASSFAQKMGWTIGGFVGGTVLAAFGYQANMAQDPEALTGLKLLMSFIPAIGSLGAALLPLLYKLDDRRMQEIEAALAERRRLGSVAPPAQGRDQLGRWLGVTVAGAALVTVGWLLVWAARHALQGQWLYVVYIASIVALFAAAVAWIRRYDARSKAVAPTPP